MFIVFLFQLYYIYNTIHSYLILFHAALELLGRCRDVLFLSTCSLSSFIMADKASNLSISISFCRRICILCVELCSSLIVFISHSEHSAYSIALIPSLSSSMTDSGDAIRSSTTDSREGFDFDLLSSSNSLHELLHNR